MIKIASATISIERGQLLELDDAEGCRIVCRAGVLWITLDRVCTDFILLAGESLTVDRPGLTIVHAFRSARLNVESPPRKPTLSAIAKWFWRPDVLAI